MFASVIKRWNVLLGRGTPYEECRTTEATAPAIINPAEPKKFVISDNIWDIMACHIWTVFSVAVSFTLLYLNFIEYAIGSEIGKDAEQTANILGALQLGVKVHELAIVASIFSIAKEWIQRCLIDLNQGILLGLVGAEGSLAQLSFLISKEFLAAVRYGLSRGMLWHKAPSHECDRKRRMFVLVVFIFTGCMISSLAGPASGVLMIPRVDWYVRIVFDITNPGPLHYPNLLVDVQDGYGEYGSGSAVDPFGPFGFTTASPTLDYWVSYPENRGDIYRIRAPDVQHTYNDGLGELTINTSTTWGRQLRGNWTHGTTIRSIMRASNLFAANYAQLYLETIKFNYSITNWNARKYSSDAGAVEVHAECRGRLLEPCPSADSSSWCYTPAKSDTASRSSRDLLLLGRVNITSLHRVSFYLTEGPRSDKYPNFATAIDIVLVESKYSSASDNIPSLSGIVVCSLSARLKSAVIFSSKVTFEIKNAEYAEYQVLANGTQEPSLPLLYHEHWLDSLNVQTVEDPNYDVSLNATGNATFARRNASDITLNRTLQKFAFTLLNPALLRSTIQPPDNQLLQDVIDVSEVEVILGGAFTSLLLYIQPTDSQYALPSTVKMSPAFLPQQHFYDDYASHKFYVYALGYGFRLSTRTGRLGVVVLVCHAVLVLSSLIWHLVRRQTVITAWKSTPDYVALALGSSLEPQTLDNTCVRISERHTLQSIIRVGVTSPEHLEIDVVQLTATDGVMDEGLSSNTRPESGVLPLRHILPYCKYGSRLNSEGEKGKLE